MSKRPNEGSQIESEPASKRIANQNENEISIISEQRLLSARIALDRLDYKNTSIICTELIDSSSLDPVGPLILRSLALERRGELQESILDAERAVELKESKKTHLRCTFAYLSKALRHLELAQKQPLENDQEVEAPLTKENMEELGNEIKKSKAREVENPFRRVSEDLLLQMASWFDSPGLVMFAATSKQLRSSIYGSTELFRTFYMTSKGKSITDGINYFSSRCGDSIRSIDIGVKEKLDQKSQELLQTAISPSSPNLKKLKVYHQGDLCKLIIAIASPCPSLKILWSQIKGFKSFPLVSSSQSLAVPPSWNPSLQYFIWTKGAESLVCDEPLLKSLQSASSVYLESQNVHPSWVVRLLSSASSTLVKLEVPRIVEEDVDEIPRTLNLPNLLILRLGCALQSRLTGDASLFFQSLHAPKLQHFSPGAFKTKDLSFLPIETHPLHFSASTLLDVDAGENAATSLVESIKNWNELQHLQLAFRGMSSEFWDHLIRLLTPLSQENVKGGFGEMPLLPALGVLSLGYSFPSIRNAPSTPPMSGRALLTLIANRKCQREGCSAAQLALLAARDISGFEQQRQEPSFCEKGTTSTIRILSIQSPLVADDETLSWLKRHVPSLRIKQRMT